jgi:hypothetical protein
MPTAAPEGVLHLGAESARRLASAARAGDVTLFAVFGGQGYAYSMNSARVTKLVALQLFESSTPVGGVLVYSTTVCFPRLVRVMRCGNECIRGNNPISIE